MRTVLKLTDEEAAAIDQDSTPLQLPRWTSLTHVQLVLELERHFGVTFDAEEIAELASTAAMMRALSRRGSPA
jgi:acyl carrier protein